MTRSARIALSFTLSALTLTATQHARATDHTDQPGEVPDVATDLTDLYVFSSGGESPRLSVVLDTFAAAKTGTRFSDVVRYEIFFVPLQEDLTRASGLTAALIPKVSCTFDAAKDQSFSCALAAGGVTMATAKGKNGAIMPSAELRVFAGARRDPFFISDAKIAVPRDPAKADEHEGYNTLIYKGVNAIVLDLPVKLLGLGGKYLGIYAQVVLPREKDGQAHDVIIDRVGRPEITNITMQDDEVKLPYNDEDTLALSPRRALYHATIVKGILKLDQADGKADWTAEALAPLADLFLDDYLTIDVTQTTSTTTQTWLGLELEKLRAKPLSSPGGRWLDDDMMDTMLTLYIGGFDGLRRTDGVAEPAQKASTTFPFLHPPVL